MNESMEFVLRTILFQAHVKSVSTANEKFVAIDVNKQPSYWNIGLYVDRCQT